MKLRLYSNSHNSGGERVRIAMALKRIDYEYFSIKDLGSAACVDSWATSYRSRIPAFMAASPEHQADYEGPVGRAWRPEGIKPQ